ncbi:MAG: pirin family protein [Planctomycetota bacterium]|nr:pirin family protein [Planctomycetota bacterium]
MILQLARERLHHRRGPFEIWRSYPGRHVGPDSGLGPIGAVDHAQLQPGLLVPMHQHRDDEIVSYLRSGEMIHTDSQGRHERISPARLMVMNAGRGFSHEESIAQGGQPVSMLQIFLRPHEPGLPPCVQFVEIDQSPSPGTWRLLAGPDGTSAPAFVRSDVFVLDASIDRSSAIDIPARDGFGWWLYVVTGEVGVGEFVLAAGDSLVRLEGDQRTVMARSDATLVLFAFAQRARFTDLGSISGRVR